MKHQIKRQKIERKIHIKIVFLAALLTEKGEFVDESNQYNNFDLVVIVKKSIAGRVRILPKLRSITTTTPISTSIREKPIRQDHENRSGNRHFDLPPRRYQTLHRRLNPFLHASSDAKRQSPSLPPRNFQNQHLKFDLKRFNLGFSDLYRGKWIKIKVKQFLESSNGSKGRPLEPGSRGEVMDFFMTDIPSVLEGNAEYVPYAWGIFVSMFQKLLPVQKRGR